MNERPGAGGAILLVEDEPFVALMAQQSLEEDGFRVALASCGADALAQAARPDLAIRAAIVDFGLPDMTGDEVVRALRVQDPALPILVASGYAVPELRAAFGKWSALHFVSKPYDGAGLKAGLAHLGVMAGG